MLRLLWTGWICASLAGAGWLWWSLPGADSARSTSTVFLPGKTTHGHHQIEMKCGVCHQPGGGVAEQSCIDCHGADLKHSRDTHPKTKFNDPAKALLLQKIDAQNCLTCHVEHQEERTHPMGVTVPEDYCFHCHQDVAKDRPSHKDFAFNSCANAGCHNYHDNTAIYENFLNKHASEEPLLSNPVIPIRKLQQWQADHEERPGKQLTAADADAPPELQDAAATREWASSPHALRGVNCSGCHLSKSKHAKSKETIETWVHAPTHDTCAVCHDHEVRGFLQGMHGVRLAVGLSAMTPRDAELPMHAAAGHRELNCSTCHAAHNPDVTLAAYQACIQCHDDEHSRRYVRSSHHQLWQAEFAGKAAQGTGVSCATCHMPRDGDGRVQHNQNLNLQPNEKMARTVCMNCHGLQFTLDALADPLLKQNCYATPPNTTVDSLRMAVEWFESRKK